MQKYRKLLVASGAIVEGHFVYASGRHGKIYVNKTAGLVLASHAEAFATRIARNFARDKIEVVVGPELGAIKFMGLVAHRLHQITGREVAGIMATRVAGTKKFEIARDQRRFLKGKRVLVLEDVLTTGESAANTVAAVKEAGGEVAAVAALWNRGSVNPSELGVIELFEVIDEPIEDFPEDNCPFCKAGIPVNTDLGKGKEFLAKEKGDA